jgi:small conductance mechanosensitive channel
MAQYGLKVLGAIAILIVGRFVAGFIRKLIKRLMSGRKVDEALVSFISSLAYIALMTFVIIAALSAIGVQTTSFVAVLGAAGLAVGFALQGGLSNFAAGVLLIIFKPFKVGDFIDGAGTAGIVEEIEIFTTTLRTPDNKTIIVPNSKLTGDNITNFTAKDTRRMDLVFGVSYTDDIDKVKKVIADVLKADKRILEDPAPTIGLVELADSSVNFAVRPWVKTSEYWDVFFDTNETMKKRFDAEGISIPFPQRDVHLYQEKAATK